MVVFVCCGCGDSVKKAQVERHRWKCRRSGVVSCADCHKDFSGEEYQAHTQCVSEDQKYGGANYVAKGNKGAAKQEKWFEQVQMAIESVDAKYSNVRGLLQQLKDYPNVPRKQQKFESFLRNSLRVRNWQMITAAWGAISAVTNQTGPPNSDSPQEDQNGGEKRSGEESNENGPDSKRKRVQSADDTNEERQVSADQFSWKRTIKKCLRETAGEEMKLKKLRKAATEEFGRAVPTVSREEAAVTFENALQRLVEKGKVRVEGKTVGWVVS